MTRVSYEGHITGGCLCGSCRYSSPEQPLNIRACHCKTCQKSTGAPFYARVLVPSYSLVLEGPVSIYKSSSDVHRGFCRVCGTSLYSARLSSGAVGLTHGSLDDPDRYPPTEHIWVSRRQDWVTVPADLPVYSEGYQ